jgi:hypothetical protein
MAPFWYGDAMRYCATENVDRTFCPKLLSTKQTFDKPLMNEMKVSINVIDYFPRK